ncbi:MAG: GNAT family N-acetyltransferase [Myxococcota bacterium]
MIRTDIATIAAEADAFDAMALNTPRVDAFCTSSAWILSAHQAFHPEQEPYVYRSDAGWLVLARGHAAGLGAYLSPMEAMWGLASPLLGGGDDDALFDGCERALLEVQDDWDALWLCGMDAGSRAFRRLSQRFGKTHRLFLGPVTRRYVADLSRGIEGFWADRARVFRKNLRRARRLADEAGVVWHWHDVVADEAERQRLYARILDVDKRSWKGLAHEGLGDSGMATFYELMTQRLAKDGRMRVVFGRLDDEDVAMGFGATFGDSFRGLQMSYDNRFRSLSLGNLVQVELITRLCDEGIASYDLGTEMDYKRRWSEFGLETTTLVIRR